MSLHKTKVCKFGGTSMANATTIKQVADVLASDAARRFVVVSAPGKREPTDTKVTDMLFDCHDALVSGGDFDAALDAVADRFDSVARGLGVQFDTGEQFCTIAENVRAGAGLEYLVSRGEYLCARIVAQYLDADFVDAEDIVVFDQQGNFDSERTNACAQSLATSSGLVVVPGFYGRQIGGAVRTFTRGGSDFSGSIVARAVQCDMYENWTDVDGFMAGDPRIIQSPRLIDVLTYKELRELSYMGANVLHPDSIFPVRRDDIPINIRNTFNPDYRGTLIVPTKHFFARRYTRAESVITGIAGKRDFASINIEKSMMNNEIGFARKVLSVLEKYDISFEQMPSGIDTLSVIFDRSKLDDQTISAVIRDIETCVSPDSIELVDRLALIAVVGHGMSRRKGTAASICTALMRADVNIRMIDQGSSELNIIIAVEQPDFENAIRALYQEFFG